MVWLISCGERWGEFPATSLSLTTTIPSYPHSPSICIIPENHLAAAEGKLLFISQNQKKKRDESSLWTWRRGREQQSKELLAGWVVSKWTAGRWEKVGRFCIVMSTRPDRALIWLFCGWQYSDFSPPTAAGIRGVYHSHTHTHTHSHTVKEVENTQIVMGRIHQVPSQTLLHTKNKLAPCCLCYSSAS